MNDDDKALVQAVVHEAAAPLMGPIADIVGLAGGDWLAAVRKKRNEKREQNQRETLETAGRLLSERGIKPAQDTGREKVADILEAAQDKSEAELKDLFGRLLAAAVDPTRSKQYRREFVQIVAQFEPLDAMVLMAGGNAENFAEGQRRAFSQRFNVTEDQIELAMRNLIKLGCARNPQEKAVQPHSSVLNIVLQPVGRELIRILR